ncbi:MAG: hypothetical protein Q9162_006300 [Coniocarpon cinnabarinum]
MALSQTNPQILHGSCTCGRNQFEIDLPHDISTVSVVLDNSAASRRAHAAPLTAYLSIPLSHYRSATYAFYPDETHRDIRRVYNVPRAALPTHSSTTSHTDASGTITTTTSTSKTSSPEFLTESQQRHFCGYCGTHFSSWSASPVIPRSEEYMRVSLESLAEEDFALLTALRLLGDDDDDEEDSEGGEDEGEDVVMSGGIGGEGGGSSEGEGGGNRERKGSSSSDRDGGSRGNDAPTQRKNKTTPARRTELKHTGGGGRAWFEQMLSGSRVADARGRYSNGNSEEVEEVEGTGKRKFEGS